MSQQYSKSCDDASTYFTATDNAQFESYLTQYPTDIPWIPLDSVHRCARVPREWQTMTNLDLGLLFSGKMFFCHPHHAIPTMIKCDSLPNVILQPKSSIFGNRMFFCALESRWYEFLLPFCAIFSNNDRINGDLQHVSVCAFSSLPNNLIAAIVPRAQGFINFSLLNIDAKTLVDSIFTNLGSVLKNNFTGCGAEIKSFGLFLQAITVAVKPSLLNCASWLYNFFAFLPLDPKLISAAVQSLMPYFTNMLAFIKSYVPGLPHAQLSDDISSSIDHTPMVSAIAVTSATMLALAVGKRIPAQGEIAGILKFSSGIGRSIMGITTLYEFISKYVMIIFDWCFEFIVGVPRNMSSLEEFESEITEYISRINRIQRDGYDSLSVVRESADVRAFILHTRAHGCSIRARLLKSKCSASAFHMFERHYTTLEKIIAQVQLHGGTGTGPRPEPLVLQIFGASGCGKSHVPFFLAADVCSWEGIEESPMSHMYSRKTANVFFDGYKPGQHLICLYDDFGQSKDTASVPNEEFREVIYACNISEWPLHMATIQEKATTYFNSSMVILTSNEVRYNIQSMTCPEAFARRIDLRFEICIADEYKNSSGGIDEAKVMADSGTAVSEVVYRFIPYSRSGYGNDSKYFPLTMMDHMAVPQKIKLTYDQMITMVRKAYTNKRNHANDRIEAMLRRFDTLKEKELIYKDVSEGPLLQPFKAVQSDRLKKDAELPLVKDPYVEKIRAQVALSAAEQYLMCFHGANGNPSVLYKSDHLLTDFTYAESVWEFLDLNKEVALRFEAIAKQYIIDDVVLKVITGNVVEDLGDSGAHSDAVGIVDTIRSYLGTLGTFIVDNLRFIGGIMAGSLVVYKLYNMLVGGKPLSEQGVIGDVETNYGEHGVSGDTKTNARPVVRVEHGVSGDTKTNARPVIRVEGAHSQAFIDVNAHEVLSSVLVNNMYRIGGVDSVFAANLVFIADRVALCNWHVFDFLKQHANVRISNLDLVRGFEVPYDQIESYQVLTRDGEFKDAVLLKFPKFVHMHKNIVRHFVRSMDISKFSKEKGILAGIVAGPRDKLIFRVEPLSAVVAQDTLRYVYDSKYTGGESKLFLRQAYNYKSQTGSGDCGSMVLINSNAIPRKICGIHAAGATGVGYATSITGEDLERCLKSFASVGDYTLHASVREVPIAQVRQSLPVGEFVPLGLSTVVAGTPSKTDIYRSPIHGDVAPVIHLPSALRPFRSGDEIIDPMQLGLKKAGVPTKYIPQHLVDMARDDYRAILFRNTDPDLQRVLNYEEVICGTDHVFVNPLNRRSSAGFGWNARAGGKIGKTKWLGNDTYIFDNVELREAFDYRIAQARIGIRAPHLWTDTLKVERRPIAKVHAGKTRVFSVGQMDYIMVARKYFLGFNAHVMSNRINNEIAVGINAYSTEWTQLAHALQVKGPDVIAGDFTNYDGTLNAQIMHACLDLINEWYEGTAEETLIREVLFEEIVSSIHLCGNVVYQWTHSQPSGNPLTTILNSMYNSISMRIVYALINGETFSFGDNVAMMSYGDDNVVNISRDIITSFNQNTISVAYAQIGMIYTNESKTGEMLDSRTLAEVEFLKRKFVLCNGRYDAPLQLATILEMVNWVRGAFEHEQLCITNCETACTELGVHSRDIYEKWSKIILLACRRQNLHLRVHNYDNVRSMLQMGLLSGIKLDNEMFEDSELRCDDASNTIRAQVVDSSNADNMQPVTQLVAPVDPVAVNESQQVTQWVDDVAKQEASLPSPIIAGSDIMAGGSETREHNIIDILERPVKIGTFTWSDTDQANSSVALYNFPSAIIDNSINVADKITHFTFFRAHVEIRIVLNANTFQAGRLMAYFAPYSNPTEIGTRALANEFLSSKSVFPRIIIDAGSGNVGILTIPYVSYYTHYDLVRQLGDLGTMSVDVLNPLQNGSATGTIFARFTNISLQVPTAAPNAFGTATAVINAVKSFMYKRTRAGRKDPVNLQALLENIDLPRAQVGEAEIRASTGVISAPARLIGNMASMGSSLPVIGSYLAPVAWIANAVSEVAAIFGFSKPMNMQPNGKFTSIPSYGFTNMDGVDNSVVLGASVENSLGSRGDVFGSGVDEMDIPFICGHESFLTSFNWSGNDAASTRLIQINVSPGSVDYINSVGTPEYSSTAMSYVASMFKYWRGSLKYKVQITKTAYHSGRLRVAFVPSGEIDQTDYDFNQGYSEIIDLRTSDEIEFTIPFVSNTIWKPNEMNRFDVRESLSSITGVIIIEVINELRNPDNVPDSLFGNIWVSGGTDIQFAVPDFMRYVPVYGQETIRAQVMGQSQDTGFNQSMINDNEMFCKPQMSAIDASAVAIGEYVQNLRALTRRFGNVGIFNISNTSALRTSNNYFGDVTDISPIYPPIAPIEYISWLYRFWRGGQRYKFVSEDTSVAGTLTMVSNPGVVTEPVAPNTSALNATEGVILNNAGSAFTHIVNLIYNRFPEITLPYFSNTHISPIRGPNVSLSEFDERSTAVIISTSNNNTTSMRVLRAASDDFSFGWLVGPPRVARRIVGISSVFDFDNVDTVLNTRGNVGLCPGVITLLQPSGADVISRILSTNTPVSFTVTYTDNSTDIVQLRQCSIYNSNTRLFLTFPVDDTKIIASFPTTESIRDMSNGNTGIQTPYIASTYTSTTIDFSNAEVDDPVTEMRVLSISPLLVPLVNFTNVERDLYIPIVLLSSVVVQDSIEVLQSLVVSATATVSQLSDTNQPATQLAIRAIQPREYIFE